MKKLLSLILTATMVLTFVSCGDDDKDTNESLANTSWKATVNIPLPLGDSIMSLLPITPTIDINMTLSFTDASKGHMSANASLPSSLGAFAALIQQYIGSYLDELKIEEDFTYTFDGVSKGEIIYTETDEETGETSTNKQSFTYNSSSKTIEVAFGDEEISIIGTNKLTFSKQ
ncbi:MAG: hypothetical protein IJ761_07095 [Bacteroidales bacterium]|nr:hypothetical protein [Bacteroidales bacterium]